MRGSGFGKLAAVVLLAVACVCLVACPAAVAGGGYFAGGYVGAGCNSGYCGGGIVPADAMPSPVIVSPVVVQRVYSSPHYQHRQVAAIRRAECYGGRCRPAGYVVQEPVRRWSVGLHVERRSSPGSVQLLH